MTDTHEPVRIERDGDVAVVVLDNPPLNLFDPAVFNALENVAAELVALTDPGYTGRARAVLIEARGKVVSGGVDVTFFRDIAESAEPVRPRRRPVDPAAAGGADVRGSAGAHGVRRARADSHGRLRAGAVLRHPAGRGEGLVRPRRDRRRPHPVDGWSAAAGRAGRPRPGPGADLHRRALPGRGPGAVERRQPGAPGRRLRRGGPRLRPPGRGRPDRRARGHEAARRRRGRATAPGPPTRWSPRSPAHCSARPTCGGRWRRFLADGPGKATYTGR